MQIKASLHLHPKEDHQDGPIIDYSIFDLIDRAQQLNFSVLAITGHESFVCLPEHVAYGQSKGILVIPGIELKLDGKHVLALNCDQAAADLHSFTDLIEYKKNHSEIFVIAPHPNYGALVALTIGQLKKYSSLFDAVEHCWYYSRKFNPNAQNAVVAQQLGLPFIATADLHDLTYLDHDYAVLEIEELTVAAVFAAIRSGNFTNVSQVKTPLEMFWYQVRLLGRKIRAWWPKK